MLRAGIAALCAVASCQAFHVPIASTSTSSYRSVTRQQDSFDKQALCHRRPRNSLSMAAADGVATTQKDENAAASAGKESATSSAAAAKEGEGDPVVAGAVDGDKKMSKSTKKRKKRAWSPKEQEYLDKVSGAPTIYKRVADAEFFPSVGYDSSFPSVEESLAVKHTGDSMFINEEGKEEVLMRVVVVGGGEEEGQFVKKLSEKGAGTLVDGLYVLWDPREGALSDTVAQVEFINVHELGSVKTRNPKKVAQHARFLAANMLVAVAAQSSYGADYIPKLKKEALEQGLTFVGPGVAAEVAKGEMATFAKLVEDTRKAMEEE